MQWGLVAGVGVVTLGVGTFFGIRAASKWSDAKDNCVDAVCNDFGFEQGSDARTSGNVSTILFIAGGVIAAGGAVLFLTARPAVGPKGAGISLQGQF